MNTRTKQPRHAPRTWKDPKAALAALEQLARAYARTGTTSLDRMQWAVSFAQEDLRGLSPGRLLDLIHDAKVYTFGDDWEAKTDPPPTGPHGGMPPAPQLAKWATRQRSTDIDELVRGQQALMDLLLQAARRQPFEIKYQPGFAPFGIRVLPEGKSDLRTIFKAPLHTAMLMKTVADLKAVGTSRIRICANPTCSRLFVAVRRQTFCQPRHSQQVRTIRFKEKHPDKVRARRHARYEHRVQRALGPRVRVGTRDKKGGKAHGKK